MASPTGRAEFQRRQKLAVGGGGKVLPSQRHQRTLSLLSPVRVQDSRVPFPRPKDLEEEEAGQVAPPMVRRAPRTTPPPPPLPIERPKNQDVLLKTGQQIAADFRDGLWTFLEDLKQATVGDEVAVPQPAAGLRRASSSRTSRERPGVRRGKRVPDVEEALIDFADEEVSSFRWSSSSAYSDYPELGGTAPASRSSTPRTSTRCVYSLRIPPAAHTRLT